MKPVVIVGAGLAGLTCARALKRQHIPFIIVEGDSRIGGRLKTDEIGNYRLDRGYQVYFSGYPNAKNQLDEEKLELQPFESGAVVIWDGEQHVVSRDNPIQTALSGFLRMGDKLRLGKWTSDVQWLDVEDIRERDDQTIEDYLREEGFSEEFIDRFARPFMGSMFMDRTLSTSSRHLMFVWKSLNEGTATLPALGIEEIPKQIGETFGHEVLWLNTKVEELLRDGDEVTGVRLSDGQTLEASAVVLATDAGEATRLSGLQFDLDYRSSITLYFSAAIQPIEGPTLVLNGNMRGITTHVVPLSNVNAFLGPIESHLISATIIGERPETDEQLAEIVKSEMLLWFPDRETEAWTFLKAYRCTNAHLAQPPGVWDRMPGIETGIPGLFLAGEITTNGSIDGAVESGVLAAEAASASLRLSVG